MSESDEEYEDIDLKLISRTQSNSVNIQESFTKQRSGTTTLVQWSCFFSMCISFEVYFSHP